MLDHVFTDAIGALRDSLERAFLERQAFEERFQVDVLLGDVTWETSYGLPGEAPEPQVVLAVLPEQSAPLGSEHLERSGPTIETVCSADLNEREFAIEVSYEGSYELD